MSGPYGLPLGPLNRLHDFIVQAAASIGRPPKNVYRLVAKSDGLHVIKWDGTDVGPLGAGGGGGSLTTAYADQTTGNVSLTTDTPADATGVSISLAAGTWVILAQLTIDTGSATYILLYITDNSNAQVGEARGTRSATSPTTLYGHAVVTPGSTTTYKLRGQAGAAATLLRYAEGTIIGTKIFALKIA